MMTFKLLTLILATVALINACGGSNSSPTQSPVTEVPVAAPEPEPTPPANAVNVNGNFILQAEDFVNSGGDGDIQTGSGDIVNFFNAGDYIEFVINIEKAGEYKVTYRASTPETGAVAGLLVTNAKNTGLTLVDSLNIFTGDWDVFEEIESQGHFNIWHSGVNTIRLIGAGTSAWQFNTDYIEFTRIGDVNENVDSDGDSISDLTDECENTETNLAVDANGCAPYQLDSDNDGITDDLDLCASTSTAIIADATGCSYSSDKLNVNLTNPSFPSFMTFDNNTPVGKRWQKLESMSDEFNSGFDTTKWAVSFWNYEAPNFNKTENTGVVDGNLWIKATLASDHETNERWFETARVLSIAKTKFPVYIESRIKAASISAYNTFWLNNGDADNRDEIDIIENNANPTYTGIGNNGQFVYADYPWHMASQYFIVKNGITERRSGDSDNRSDISENNTLKGVAWDDDYHVFGAWWKDANNVQFYLNGEPVGSIRTTQNFTLDQQILFDLWTSHEPWVGGLPAKSELANDSINTMYVDWVRTWQLVDE